MRYDYNCIGNKCVHGAWRNSLAEDHGVSDPGEVYNLLGNGLRGFVECAECVLYLDDFAVDTVGEFHHREFNDLVFSGVQAGCLNVQ